MKYWKDRKQDQLYNELVKYAEGLIGAEFRRLYNLTYEQLVKLYDELLAATADGSLLVSDLYKFNRYYDMLNNLNTSLTATGSAVTKVIDKTLTEMYKKNTEVINKENGWTSSIDETAIKNAINTIWCKDGKVWSARIWGSLPKLQETIMKNIVDCVARGTSIDTMTKEVMKDMGVGYNQAVRVARTELSYVQIQSTLKRYEEMGCDKYEIYHAHDKKVCSEKCEKLDGQIFYIKEAVVGVNCPPIHPFAGALYYLSWMRNNAVLKNIIFRRNK